MAKLRFSDGMEFETSGPMRVVQRSDGWYVVGEGCVIPMKTQEMAERYITELEATKRAAADSAFGPDHVG